ncbi:hypothetical protein [Aquimarina algiphila]|uniref:hypothetical protein n=1 Tax=Aquimarina algiphila TaxID=2047982 RepID=UPI00232DDE76|nr:hypothetical protein [Aquimarina algiphila]
MKQQDEKTEEGLKKAIYRLIEPDENFCMASLDAIYHDDMIVIMIDQNENKTIFRKDAFKKLIASKLEGEERTKNTWAKFIHTEVNQDKGHIVVKRRVNLTEENNELTVILDFVWEDNRWQIIREVIFSYLHEQ